MKKFIVLLVAAGIILAYNTSGKSQIVDPGKKIEKEGENRANKNTDKGINKGYDKIEEGIGNIFKKKKKKDKKTAEPQDQENEQIKNQEQQVSKKENRQTTSAPELEWAKYDFVPGDKVFFEDNLLNEENGEFPSRWDLVQGNVEMAKLNGENVIMFRDGSPTIIPYLKNSANDYLPEVFTLEFDLFLPSNSFTIYFSDRKNQSIPSGSNSLSIWTDRMEFNPAKSSIPNNGNIIKKWAHIAVAYTNGKMKAYIDETRLINIPRLNFNPTGISFHVYHAGNNNLSYIKNIRLAEGGVKYYDRFLQDGKIIANGIRFNVNEATLLPESMGVINEIAELMRENQDIKFSVEGHTDSDGDNDSNQILSENRAQTVMKTLIKLGIDANRLSSKGWGETKPIDTNNSPEGKANNRRVEFVKM